MISLDYVQKTGIFDELKFNTDINKIKFIELSHEIDNNFVILAVDGTVYKYDLATREMVYSFKTVSTSDYHNLLVYSKHSKLCAYMTVTQN